MNCFINKTDKQQGFVQAGDDTYFVPKNGIVPEMNRNMISGVDDGSIFDYIRLNELYSYIKSKNGSIEFVRSRALGDVLMLRSLLPFFVSKYGFNVSIKTSGLNTVVNDFNKELTKPSFTFNLNGTVEKDHSFTRFSQMHRIDIFAEALGLKKFELDFNLDFSGEPLFDSRYIIVQGRGSADVKTAKDDLFDFVVKHLALRFPEHIIAVLNERQPAADINRLFVLKDTLSFVEFWASIKYADFIVSLDSAPLWVSHYTKTPVLALLGSVPISTRMIYHPLYNEGGAIGIELYKLIGCAQCNETAHFCNGKISCLELNNKSRLLEDYEKALANLGELI